MRIRHNSVRCYQRPAYSNNQIHLGRFDISSKRSILKKAIPGYTLYQGWQMSGTRAKFDTEEIFNDIVSVHVSIYIWQHKTEFSIAHVLIICIMFIKIIISTGEKNVSNLIKNWHVELNLFAIPILYCSHKVYEIYYQIFFEKAWIYYVYSWRLSKENK